MKSIKKPIEVMAYFDIEGNVTPYRFRYCGKDTKREVIAIEKIIEMNINKFSGNPVHVFECMSQINEKEIIYKIQYEVNSHKWRLSYK